MNFIILDCLAFNLLRTLISYRLCLIKAFCGDFSNCGYGVYWLFIIEGVVGV